MRTVVIMIATAAVFLGVSAMAQESRSEISLQGTGFFTKDTSGHGTTERTTNTGGFLVGYRYNLTRWLAAEAVYGYDRNTQHYFGTSGLSVITGQSFESHCKNSGRKALFSCDWIFQEKELCFRFRSWRVSAGGRAPMNYDSLYPTFCAAAQA